MNVSIRIMVISPAGSHKTATCKIISNPGVIIIAIVTPTTIEACILKDVEMHMETVHEVLPTPT